MIRLERFDQSDFQQLISWIKDEELLTIWSGNLFRFPLTTNSLEWYIKDTNVKDSSDAFVYKVVNAEGVSIGHISLGGISWQNRSARITRVLVGDTAQRGAGFCQHMMKAVLQVAFDELDLHRVSLGVYENNMSAARCYEKSGFVTEGVNRDILWYKDKWWSMIEMSILETEWRNTLPSLQ